MTTKTSILGFLEANPFVTSLLLVGEQHQLFKTFLYGESLNAIYVIIPKNWIVALPYNRMQFSALFVPALTGVNLSSWPLCPSTKFLSGFEYVVVWASYFGTVINDHFYLWFPLLLIKSSFPPISLNSLFTLSFLFLLLPLLLFILVCFH